MGERVLFRQVVHLDVPPKLFKTFRSKLWGPAWSKLQIFNLTDWDRLVWIDTDGIFTKNMDHLFRLKGTWMQGDDGRKIGKNMTTGKEIFLCGHTDLPPCSGLISFVPGQKTFRKMMAFAATLESVGWADMSVITEYFAHVGRPVKVLGSEDASFGQCWRPDKQMTGFLHKPTGSAQLLRPIHPSASETGTVWQIGVLKPGNRAHFPHFEGLLGGSSHDQLGPLCML